MLWNFLINSYDRQINKGRGAESVNGDPEASSTSFPVASESTVFPFIMAFKYFQKSLFQGLDTLSFSILISLEVSQKWERVSVGRKGKKRGILYTSGTGLGASPPIFHFLSLGLILTRSQCGSDHRNIAGKFVP